MQVAGVKSFSHTFNGKEDNPAWSADAVVQDYGFRLYSTGIGRFLSVDPLASSFPWYTPYQFAGNKPINSRDLDGLEEIESFTASGIANLYPVEITARKMTAIEINYYRRARTALKAGYSYASAHKYAQIMQGGGPMARALGMRMASNAPPIELSGNISITVTTDGITSDFANNVAQASYDAISAVITLPLGGTGAQPAARGAGFLQLGRRLAGGLRSSQSISQAWKAFEGTYKLGRTGSSFLSNSDMFARGVSAFSNLQSQGIRNASSGDSGIEVFELAASIVAPRNFAFQGLVSGAGVRFHPGADKDSEFSFDPSLLRSVKGSGIGIGMQSLSNRVSGNGGLLLGIAGKTFIGGSLDALQSTIIGNKDLKEP